jgi:hypothetical protein
MFGLTKREQRWKAEQQAAELFLGSASTILKYASDVQVAKSRIEADELHRVRALYDELIYAVASRYSGETRHETALRYIKAKESSSLSGTVSTQLQEPA